MLSMNDRGRSESLATLGIPCVKLAVDELTLKLNCAGNRSGL